MKKKMGQFYTNSPFIIFQLATTLILLLWSCPNCIADTNDSRGSLCSTPKPGDDESPSWTANLNSVFSSLEANVNLNNGYYRAEAGNSADKVYGLIQCRGDIPQSDCQNCTRESFRQATERCGGRSVVVWQKRCFLRYSNTSFYGVWERTRFAVTNSTDRDRDDPKVVEKGRAMMSGLAEEAPKRTLMFATSVTTGDDGGGKRYGLGQCSRDLKRSDCEDCLDYLMENTGTEITNKQYWETYAVGCFMLYDDHQFYFNSSTSANPPASQGSIVWAGRFSVGMAILTTAMAYL